MAEKMDMSLDDIIKKEGIKARRPGAGGAGGPGKGGPQRRRGAVGGGRFAGKARSTPYTKGTGKWTHDRFEGGRGGGPSAHLVVSNLDYGVTDKDIKELFTEFGGLKKAAVHYDKSGRSQGTADVVFANRAAALKAISQYNGVPLDGRPMKIELVASPSSPIKNVAQRVGKRNPGGAGPGPAKGRGGKNPRQPKKEVTQEELDADLDAFVSKT